MVSLGISHGHGDRDSEYIDIHLLIKDSQCGDELRTHKPLLSTKADHNRSIGVSAQAVDDALEFAHEQLKSSPSFHFHLKSSAKNPI